MMKDFIDGFLDGKCHQRSVIDTKDIEFSEHVLAACKMNHCGRYNTCWSCPPASGKLSEIAPKYRKFKFAYVFTTKSDLEDCFDIEGMESARERHTVITDELRNLLKKQENNFEFLGAGSCNICAKCTYPAAPCRFPERMYHSVEACGIDVVNLAKTCNINYINGENTVTYFSVIFFD